MSKRSSDHQRSNAVEGYPSPSRKKQPQKREPDGVVSAVEQLWEVLPETARSSKVWMDLVDCELGTVNPDNIDYEPEEDEVRAPRKKIYERKFRLCDICGNDIK